MTDTMTNVEILFVRAIKVDCDNLEHVRKVINITGFDFPYSTSAG